MGQPAKEWISSGTAYGGRAECHFSNLRHEPLVLMVAGHIPGRDLCSRARMHLERKSPFHPISLYGSVIHIRARSGTATTVDRPFSIRRRSIASDAEARWGQRSVGRVGGGPEKKSGIAVFTSGRDSSKIEAIPVAATLRMAERSDTFRWMRVLQRYRLRYGTLIHFTLIAKYGTSVSVQKKGGKEIYVEANSLANWKRGEVQRIFF